ncbi:hypothetical protein [Rhodoflexus caldus]|uniref:hypothetical protein n=1 Tax=Rhodoflexus caldus TaxID=2891236 RepID=UPI00202A48FD|nr:hypothetical protein [Rhodoflexus caldus]
MKKIRFALFAFILLGAASCGIKNHNRAKLVPVNADDTRIYGDIGGPALQLANKYEDDKTGKTQERIGAIRDKFFPK